MINDDEPVETITDGQISRVSDHFSKWCRANAVSLPKDAVQLVLDYEGDALALEMFEALRVRVERHTSIIARSVQVDRTRTPQGVIDATGRKQYIDAGVVVTMPRGEGDKKDVFFFKLDRHVSDEELEKEYAFRSLVPADPYSLSAVNEADPAFGYDHPNITHWKDPNKKWCFIAFRHWNDERSVRVNSDGRGWDDYWWFAGVSNNF